MTDAKYFLIGTDGRHHGPLSTDDVRKWLADGLASRYSRARREAEDQWAALRDMPEFEEETRPPHLSGRSLSEAEPVATDDAHQTAAPQQGAAAHGLDPLNCFQIGRAHV